MTRMFAVINRRGPNWRRGIAMENQDQWRAHADFMNAMAAEGFCLLAGPLEGSNEVLLAYRADSAETVARRISEDPWFRNGFLETVRIAPWDLRIGELD